MNRLARHYKELDVYRNGFAAAMDIFKITKQFPAEEKYSMVDQIRRSSRSVCTNLAEAWRKRRYEAAFVAKLNDVAGEADETQVWVAFAQACGYISVEEAKRLDDVYDHIAAQITLMNESRKSWLLK